MEWQTPVLNLMGVGPFVAKKLNRLGIKTLGDLIYHFPFRYEDFSKITPINKLKLNEVACVFGKIIGIENKRAWKKRMDITTAILEDKTGTVKAVWFNQGFIEQNLKPGQEVYLAGKLKQGKAELSSGKTGLFLSSPIYE
ncbi:MAG: DNA helicase RecG, partial [Candidatus Pacebacteria bacterium]|nr:DNA helicase RecG [Candidatus Paceibacterota bacterium]